MTVETETMLSAVAREIEISEDELLKSGIRAFLERQLRQIKTQVFAMTIGALQYCD